MIEMRSRVSVNFLILLFLIGACSEEKKIESVESVKPEPNRFTPVVVTPAGALDEPMMFEILEDGSAIIIERFGIIKKWDAARGVMIKVGSIPVFTHSEQGLVGMILDPNFKTNHWIYLYYADASIDKFFLTRWELVKDSLIESSKKVLLEVPSNRESTSHTGGGMAWDAHGNLYLTIGNNTGNSIYSQTDERPDRLQFDDQRGAANTNDLRGKILRIHPETEGTYTIPNGNLFPKGMKNTRPEIYIMGNRNPWRVSVDSKTGFLYWGEVGPDADSDTEKGPMGYDELNQAKVAGFFGWPYFIGENNAYPMYDYISNTLGDKQDPTKPYNKSKNNTGLSELPPAQPAFISYPYRPSEKFPIVGSSSRCAIGGPVFHRADFKNPVRPFPAYYEGMWLAADLSRFWIMAISMDEHGNYLNMERFAPYYHPRQPIDIKFGSSGDLYVLEYGGNTANSPIESRLVRIEYNAGNRKPVVQISFDKQGGSVPLTINLSSKGTIDYDGDSLTYQWSVVSEGKPTQNSTDKNAEFVIANSGVYKATLTVTDTKRLSNTASIQVTAGNEPPQISLSVDGNQTFFFSENTIHYQTNISDKEDGTLGKGISSDAVAFSIDYLSQGFDYAAIMVTHGEASRFAIAKSLMAQSDCRTCHNEKEKGVGPSFDQIANKYKSNPKAPEVIIDKIRNGSSGAWNLETAMPAHPTITSANAGVIVNYILNHDKKPELPLTGDFKFNLPSQDNGLGAYILRAAYADEGNDDLPSLSAESIVILKSSKLLAINADQQQGVIRDQLDEYTFLTTKPNSFITFSNIDLTGIREISFRPNWHLYDIYKGGKIEVRLDSEHGELLGETNLMPKQFNVRYRGAFAPPPGSPEKGVEIDKQLPPLDMSKFFARGSDKSSYTIPSVIRIKEVKGLHTLYFVFKNTEAKAEDSLFPLSSIEFKIK